jgi:hypothetical protein
MRANQDSGASELRKSMLRDQAARMERDLAEMRRNIEAQMATATRTVDEARASKLEQDLAAARRDVETQTALAAKADAEASQLKKTADAGTADVRRSLQLERDRASKLEHVPPGLNLDSPGGGR